MGLINLTTDLKSLKFGSDKLGGGKSNQPYIQTPIPEGDLSNVLLYGTGGPDFLLRGGTLLPNRILQDEKRLSKFFIDTKSPKGLLFTTNQNLLSRMAVKTEMSNGPSYIFANEGLYSPTNTILQAGGVAFGLHLNKQGIDSSGEISSISLNKYYNIVKNKPLKENRLFNLLKFRILEKDNSPTIWEYSGGPGSILGIGTTKINFEDSGNQRTGLNNVLFATNPKLFLKGEFKAYITGSNTQSTNIQYPFNYPQLLSGVSAIYTKLKNQQLTEPIFPSIYKSGSLDLNTSVDVKGAQKYYGESGSNVNLGSTKFYRDEFPTDNDYSPNASVIDFNMSIISNDGNETKILYFPAYIDSFTDNFTADWKAEKFMGRGEDFYTYNGFSREFSLSLKAYAHNRFLLDEMYNNWNEVTAALTPDYNAAGFMRGNIIKLSIGRWIEQLPIIITSLNYTLPMEHSWDIINYETQIPFYLDINMNFKPIFNWLPNIKEKQFGRNVPSAGPRR